MKSAKTKSHKRVKRLKHQEDPGGSDMVNQFVDRLLSLKSPGESDAVFAKRLGIRAEYFSRWRKDYGVTLITVANLSRKLNVDPRWLAFGAKEHENDPYETGIFKSFEE